MSRATREGSFIIALDIGGTKIDVAAAAMDGRLLEKTRLNTDAAEGTAQAVERAIAAATAIADASSAQGAEVRASAVGTPGVVAVNGTSLTPNLPDLDALQVVSALEAALGVPAVAINDVKAAGLAEARWGALRDADPAILLNLGTGLSAALIVGGEVIAGAHGAAGEIGYCTLRVDETEGASVGRAPLEERVSGAAIGARAAEMLGTPATAAEALGHSGTAVSELVDDALQELAVHVANLAVALDPARIAVAGGLMGADGRVLKALRRRLDDAVPFPPEVVPARFLHDAGVRGAVIAGLRLAARLEAGRDESQR
jgi:glucokinase